LSSLTALTFISAICRSFNIRPGSSNVVVWLLSRWLCHVYMPPSWLNHFQVSLFRQC